MITAMLFALALLLAYELGRKRGDKFTTWVALCVTLAVIVCYWQQDAVLSLAHSIYGKD